MKRDGVCNPVTHVLQIAEIFKRFGQGCKKYGQNSFSAVGFLFSASLLAPTINKFPSAK
jgi:hypothetical protein